MTELKWNQEVLTTNKSNEEAIGILVKKKSRDRFAMNLVKEYGLKKSAGKKLSESQLYWIHRLSDSDEKPPVKCSKTFYIQEVYNLLTTAKDNGLKHPKITLNNYIDDDELEYFFSLAGKRSKYEGNIVVTVGNEYYNYDNLWMTINPESGEVVNSKQLTDKHAHNLEILLSTFSTHCEIIGQLSGRCCFCRKKLTDTKSVRVGYGAKCAKSYGLNY